MDPIRLATPEEIEAIAAKADLTPGSMIVAFGKNFAVLRQCTELDPVFFEEGLSDQKKLFFISNLETFLRLNGVPQYYFNVRVDDERWRQIVEKYGAETTSLGPEYRYKKAL